MARPRTSDPRLPITVSVTKSFRDRLHEEAGLRGVSVSALVEQGMRAWLDTEEAAAS